MTTSWGPTRPGQKERDKKPFHLIILFLISPYLVGFALAADDSSSTSISLGAGGGSYAVISRDCSGDVLSVRDVPFEDVAVSVDHYTPVLHLNIGGGSIPASAAEEIFDIQYGGMYDYRHPPAPLNRVLYARSTRVNTEGFGLDIGAIAPVKQSGYLMNAFGPIGTLRVGKLDYVHFRLRMMDDLPLPVGGRAHRGPRGRALLPELPVIAWVATVGVVRGEKYV